MFKEGPFQDAEGTGLAADAKGELPYHSIEGVPEELKAAIINLPDKTVIWTRPGMPVFVSSTSAKNRHF